LINGIQRVSSVWLMMAHRQVWMLVTVLGCCVPSGEATNTNFIVFGMTRSRLEPTIYHTQDEHANQYVWPTCLTADCWFSVLALAKSNSACWSRTKQTSLSPHWKLTCPRHDIAGKLLSLFIKDLVMWRHYNVTLENSDNTTCVLDNA
jgi:hypothetical protein